MKRVQLHHNILRDRLYLLYRLADIAGLLFFHHVSRWIPHVAAGRGSLVLRHSAPYFPLNFGDIACSAEEFNAAFCLKTRARQIKMLIFHFVSRNQTHNLSRLQSHACAPELISIWTMRKAYLKHYSPRYLKFQHLQLY